jgi:hypothetical protein
MEGIILPGSTVISRMEDQIARWTETSDQRSIFLRCYLMMTKNMDSAILGGKFLDSIWVAGLLHRFAEYYFTALQDYERNPKSAPRVWQVAHDFSRSPRGWALQKLLLGVNAHINYDLVLTVTEVLKPVWDLLPSDAQHDRYKDFTFVNEIISRTVDAVQDEVIEPEMPVMELIDRLLGREDERLISRILSGWREKVWQNALGLLQAKTPDEHLLLVRQVEADSLKHARVILLTDLELR